MHAERRGMGKKEGEGGIKQLSLYGGMDRDCLWMRGHYDAGGSLEGKHLSLTNTHSYFDFPSHIFDL
jgi:hypothetical protein